MLGCDLWIDLCIHVLFQFNQLFNADLIPNPGIPIGEGWSHVIIEWCLRLALGWFPSPWGGSHSFSEGEILYHPIWILWEPMQKLNSVRSLIAQQNSVQWEVWWGPSNQEASVLGQSWDCSLRVHGCLRCTCSLSVPRRQPTVLYCWELWEDQNKTGVLWVCAQLPLMLQQHFLSGPSLLCQICSLIFPLDSASPLPAARERPSSVLNVHCSSAFCRAEFHWAAACFPSVNFLSQNPQESCALVSVAYFGFFFFFFGFHAGSMLRDHFCWCSGDHLRS